MGCPDKASQRAARLVLPHALFHFTAPFWRHCRLALIIPNYKQTWAAIRKLADAPEGVRHLTFKSEHYSLG
jgi:hypothetical protein